MSSRTNRPSPSESATLFSVGTAKLGNDGEMWEVASDSRGVKRWKRRSSNARPDTMVTSNSANTSSNSRSIMITVGGNNIYIPYRESFFRGRVMVGFDFSALFNLDTEALGKYLEDRLPNNIYSHGYSVGSISIALYQNIIFNNDVQQSVINAIQDFIASQIKTAAAPLTNAPQTNKVTIADINNLEPDDIVLVESEKFGFNIRLDIRENDRETKQIFAKQTDILQPNASVDKWFASYSWFIDDDWSCVIIKDKDVAANTQSRNQPTTDVGDPDMKRLDVFEAELEIQKKSVSQLLVLKSFLPAIEFEKKIEINQSIAAAQKKINDLNFHILESRLNKDDLLDDLFEQSFKPITNNYNGVFSSSVANNEIASTEFFTPDGSPSKLSDSLNELIRTPQFKEWFGNWEVAYNYKDIDAADISCSTVLTNSFEPLIVWHGTGSQFSYFKFDSFPAAYFAVSQSYSKWFADLHGGGDGYTIPFFLNIRNPLDLSNFGTRKVRTKEFFDYVFLKTGMTITQLEVNPLFMDNNVPPMETWVYLRNNAKMIKLLSENDVFDGIHFYETNPSVPLGEAAHSTEAFIIFKPDQCKIADPERGSLLFASFKSFLLKKGGKI